MHKSENSVIPCSTEIDLTGIPTVGNVTEIKLYFRNTEIPRKLLTERIALVANKIALVLPYFALEIQA